MNNLSLDSYAVTLVTRTGSHAKSLAKTSLSAPMHVRVMQIDGSGSSGALTHAKWLWNLFLHYLPLEFNNQNVTPQLMCPCFFSETPQRPVYYHITQKLILWYTSHFLFLSLSAEITTCTVYIQVLRIRYKTTLYLEHMSLYKPLT